MEIENLKKEVAELKAWKASLEASHSIPLKIDQAFRARFLTGGDEQEVTLSSTAANAFTIDFTTPDDGALSAAGAPDALLEVTVNGVVYKIPVYA